jgi:hypothetical protein
VLLLSKLSALTESFLLHSLTQALIYLKANLTSKAANVLAFGRQRQPLLAESVSSSTWRRLFPHPTTKPKQNRVTVSSGGGAAAAAAAAAVSFSSQRRVFERYANATAAVAVDDGRGGVLTPRMPVRCSKLRLFCYRLNVLFDRRPPYQPVPFSFSLPCESVCFHTSHFHQLNKNSITCDKKNKKNFHQHPNTLPHIYIHTDTRLSHFHLLCLATRYVHTSHFHQHANSTSHLHSY